MRRLIASLLAVTFFFAVASCGKPSEPEDTGTTSTETATLTTETSDTTGTTTDKEYGPERVTEEPDYGDGQIADICELMKSVTGKKIVRGMALVEDHFEQSFEEEFKMDYDAWVTTYEEDPKGEDQFTYSYTMKVTSGDLSFNKFRFTTNQAIGNVYIVEFVCSINTKDSSPAYFDYSIEELQEYYVKLEKELTEIFGTPVNSSPSEAGKPWKSAYSEFKVGNDLIYRIDYESFINVYEVVISCQNRAERKHFLLGYEAEQNTPETTSELYYKDSTNEDIVYDEKTGLSYIKNQLLISCSVGTPNDKEKIQKICDEIGAEIVGYIEIVSDFQIEFERDMTYDELMKIAKELTEKYYFIERVDLNYAVRYNSEDDFLD